MSDEIREQLSALVDGELPDNERELLLRRLTTDPALRQRWERFYLIRDGLHQELPNWLDMGLADRVSRSLEAEPTFSGKEVSRGGTSRFFKPVAGFAIAVSVAAIAIVGLRTFSPGERTPTQVATTDTTQSPQEGGTRWDLREPELQARLNGYLVNHSEYTASTNIQGMMHYTRIAGYDAQQ